MAKIKHAQKLRSGGFGARSRDWTSQLQMAFPDDFGLKTRWFQQSAAMERSRHPLQRCLYESLPVLSHCFIICREVYNIHWIKWVKLRQSSADVSPAQCMQNYSWSSPLKNKARLWPALHTHRREERGTRIYLTYPVWAPQISTLAWVQKSSRTPPWTGSGLLKACQFTC